MTIKNRGGVFGRNPTFNDVDVDGTLSVGGAAIPAPANTAKLDTAQTFTATQTMASGTGGILTLKTTDATGASGDTLGKIDFFAGDTSGGSTGVQASVRGVYDTNGDSTALVFVTGYSTGSGSPTLVERMRVRSGGGITFNGDTAAANALSDYEEGLWSPTVSANSGTITSYSATGKYTKIGRLINLSFSITITDNGTGSSALFVAGLPFTAANDKQEGGAGREDASTGNGLVVGVRLTNQLIVNFYDGSYPAANGRQLNCSIAYTV